MTFFRWQKGRQNTGYEKMRLATAKWPCAFDVYLLRFKCGDEVPPHKDGIDSGRHHRINIILKQAKEGGVFICKDAIFETSRIKYFRPDISTHELTEITKGRRLVLSIGWLRDP